MIRPLNPETDFAEWLRMRLLLWDDSTAEEHAAEMRELLAQETFAVFVAERPDGNGLAGFLEVGQRLYGEGCDTSPIAYMEGWFVEESARRQGIGRGLFAAGEAWARQRGYSEIGSDTWLDNDISHHAHLALGYEEVERLIVYRKWLVV